jgi:hypothetical protein
MAENDTIVLESAAKPQETAVQESMQVVPPTGMFLTPENQQPSEDASPASKLEAEQALAQIEAALNEANSALQDASDDPEITARIENLRNEALSAKQAIQNKMNEKKPVPRSLVQRANEQSQALHVVAGSADIESDNEQLAITTDHIIAKESHSAAAVAARRTANAAYASVGVTEMQGGDAARRNGRKMTWEERREKGRRDRAEGHVSLESALDEAGSIGVAIGSKAYKLIADPLQALEEAGEDIGSGGRSMGAGAQAMWNGDRAAARDEALRMGRGVRNVTGSEVAGRAATTVLNTGATTVEKTQTTGNLIADMLPGAGQQARERAWGRATDAASRNAQGAADGIASLFGRNKMDNGLRPLMQQLNNDGRNFDDMVTQKAGRDQGMHTFDIDGNGRISVGELATVLRNNGVKFEDIKGQGNSIDYNKLTTAMQNIARRNQSRVQ